MWVTEIDFSACLSSRIVFRWVVLFKKYVGFQVSVYVQDEELDIETILCVGTFIRMQKALLVGFFLHPLHFLMMLVNGRLDLSSLSNNDLLVFSMVCNLLMLVGSIGAVLQAHSVGVKNSSGFD